MVLLVSQGDESLSITAKRWIPPSKVRRDALSQENRNDFIFRKVRGILNKLTPEKFKKLSDDILKLEELNQDRVLLGVIILIFEKALDEPKYSSMYARLCQRLCEEAPSERKTEPCTFRVLLVNSCKEQFKARSSEKSNKRKSLGNIKFIGELFKLQLLHEGILHECIWTLLHRKNAEEMTEDLECLCQIMRTCGHILESNEKAQEWFGKYFERMGKFSKDSSLPIRIRFMLRDVIELKNNKWVPRKATITEGPIPITQMTDDGIITQAPQLDRLPQQELFSRSTIKNRSLEGGLTSSLSLAQPEKLSLYTNGFQGGFRDRGPQQRQNNHLQQQPHFYNQRFNNQHNNNNSNNVSNAKDLPPRFKRMITTHDQTSTNIELRPEAQSMLVSQPNSKLSSQHYGGGKLGLLSDTLLAPPTMKTAPPVQTTKEMPILIKQASMERSKPSKKDKATTKEETLKKVNGLGEEILSDGNITEAVSNFSQLKIPDRLLPECLFTLLSKTYDKTDTNRESMMSFLISLKKDDIIAPTHFAEAFRNLLKSVPDVESSVPKAYNCIADFAAKAVTNGLLSIAQIGELTEDGVHFPLLLLCLQGLSLKMENQQLTDLFNESKVSLMNSLPESDRTKEKLCEVLEEKNLVFLEPLLVLEAELWSALEREPSAESLLKCAKDSVNPSHHNSPPFVTALLTVCLRYITQESGVSKDGANTISEKTLQVKEKELLKRFKSVLQEFLGNNLNLQVTAVYALQVFCYSLGFPKGMLLRWFNNLYDLDIVEEEAFLKWREDVTDAYPGKGKALFQVNQWLTWLAEAESEEEEEEEGDN